MEKKTKDFLDKIRINTYIYTFTFMAIAVGYCVKHDFGGAAPIMLLIAAFAFYTLGRQVRLVSAIESGTEIDNKPKVAPWIRGIVYFVILLMVLSLMFS